MHTDIDEPAAFDRTPLTAVFVDVVGRAGTGSRVAGSTILTGSGRVVSRVKVLCLDPLVGPVIGRTKTDSCLEQ